MCEPWYYDRALRIPLYGMYHRRRASAICSALPKGIEVLLDIGCAGGTITELIAKCTLAKRVIGVDVDERVICYARKVRPSIEFYVANATRLPFSDNSVDAVTMIEVLEHMQCPQTALREAHRVLKPGGTLVVVVPDEESLLYRIVWPIWTKTLGRCWNEKHVYGFNERKLKRMLVRTGFKDLKTKRVNLGMLLLANARK